MQRTSCILDSRLLALVLVAGLLGCGGPATTERGTELDRAIAVFVTGDYRAAIARLEAVAARADSSYATRREAYTYIGRAHMALGETDAAVTAFTLGAQYGDRGPCIEYLEVLKQYIEGTPGHLQRSEAITRAQLAGAIVRLFGLAMKQTSGGGLDPTGVSPLETLARYGWMPRLSDGRDHADAPVTRAVLYVVVARILDEDGLAGRAGEILPGGYPRTKTTEPVTGAEALAALERARTMKESHGR